MAGLVRTLREGDSVKVNGVTFKVWKLTGRKAVIQTDAPKEMEIQVSRKPKKDGVNHERATKSDS